MCQSNSAKEKARKPGERGVVLIRLPGGDAARRLPDEDDKSKEKESWIGFGHFVLLAATMVVCVIMGRTMLKKSPF